MYILLDNYSRVKEIIPEFDENIPGVPLSDRYPKDFVDALIFVEDGTDIGEGYRFNEETGIWEYVEVDDGVTTYRPEEALAARISALESENKLLKEQNEALSDQMDFYEECMVEMAAIVYA